MNILETRAAQFISYVFHPLLMPTLGIFILLSLDTYLNYTITPAGKIAVYSIVFINTAVVPALLTYFQYRFRLISSLKMQDRKERTFPFLVTTFFYFFCYFILKKNNLPPPVCHIMLGVSISLLFAFLINFFWKISIHSIGAGGIIGMLFGVSQKMNVELIPLLFLFILVGGMVGFARLKLNAHTHLQVYCGIFLGFITVVVSLFYDTQ